MELESLFSLFVAVNLCDASKSMSISEQYEAFRKSHTISHLTVSGNDWSYIAAGAGMHTVVILPGGGGIDADCMFPVVLALERQYRVIAIGYAPTATTVKELVEGVRAILDDRGVEHCCMLGHSLGGFIVRAFVQDYPRQIDSLILANSAVYIPRRAGLGRGHRDCDGLGAGRQGLFLQDDGWVRDVEPSPGEQGQRRLLGRVGASREDIRRYRSSRLHSPCW